MLPVAMLHIVADTWLGRHDHQLTAVGSVILTVLLALLVDRALSRRGRQFATTALGGPLSPVADTRLRFLRRLIDATIVVIGLAIALSQFTALDRIAGTVLASSAIAAVVIGFAARQTLANAIAGVFLAVTQPLRIGDLVTFEGESGTVEDVRLTYTFLRTPGDARIIIPNERLAAGILHNDSIVSDTVALETAFWLPRDADAARVIEAIEHEVPGARVSVAEVAHEGIRLTLAADPVTPADRAVRESELRVAALRAEASAVPGRRSGNDGESLP
jgi:small-conductance mechanosensitive channel